MNNMEMASLLSSLLTFFCGYFTYEDLGFTSHVPSILALIIQLMFILVGGRVLYDLNQDFIKAQALQAKKYGSQAGSFGGRLVETLKRQASMINFSRTPSKKAAATEEPVKAEEPTSGVVVGMSLEDFLDENIQGFDIRVAAFREHALSEYSNENIDFWMEVRAFRKQSGAETMQLELWEKSRPLPDELQPIVKGIIDKYVREESDFPVNLPQLIQQPLLDVYPPGGDAKDNGDGKVGKYTCHMLDDAYTEIQRLMGRDSYGRFQDSEYWQKLNPVEAEEEETSVDPEEEIRLLEEAKAQQRLLRRKELRRRQMAEHKRNEKVSSDSKKTLETPMQEKQELPQDIKESTPVPANESTPAAGSVPTPSPAEAASEAVVAVEKVFESVTPVAAESTAANGASSAPIDSV